MLVFAMFVAFVLLGVFGSCVLFGLFDDCCLLFASRFATPLLYSADTSEK